MNRSFLPLVALLVACGGNNDDTGGLVQNTKQTTEEGRCDLLSETELTLDDPSEGGFNAAGVLLVLEGQANLILEYPDELTDGLEVTITYNGGAIFWRERESSGAVTADLAADCFDALEIEVDLGFTSDDGNFAESWPVTLRARERELAFWRTTVDAEDLAGAWTPEVSGIDSSLYSGFEIEFDSSTDEDGHYGTAVAMATPVGGSDPEDLDIVSWAPPTQQGR